MKNLLIYINPRKDFDDEGKIAVKIQIDNSLDLGWKKEDIMLVTNFPYEYRDIKSIILNDDVLVDFDPQSTKVSAIVNLFERGLIDKDALYWVHDLDAYQVEVITESELDLGKAAMALTDWGLKTQWCMCSYFFKKSAKDIFGLVKEIMYKDRVSEEYAMMALTTNARERVKKLNISYTFWPDALSQTYEIVVKPIKVLHFHFNIDLLLDSVMYGKNSLNLVLMSERLIKIFHEHGVKGTRQKKMKNLMIYTGSEKKDLINKQIENSLKMGWRKEDIIVMQVDNANKAGVIFQLLSDGVVKEAQLWWYHDLDVFQIRPFDSSEIDLEDTTAGFVDFKSFFFRKGSDKIFEWIRNRARGLGTDEATALMTLVESNYRNINNMYKKLNLKPGLIAR